MAGFEVPVWHLKNARNFLPTSTPGRTTLFALRLHRIRRTYGRKCPQQLPGSENEYDVRGRRWIDGIARVGSGRAFGRMRVNLLAANSAILKRLAQIDNTLFLHDSALRDLYQKLRPLLAPPPVPPKPRIGFTP